MRGSFHRAQIATQPWSGILALITGSTLDGVAPYVDSVMVLITFVAFLPAPLRMIRGTIVELLEGCHRRRWRRPSGPPGPGLRRL